MPGRSKCAMTGLRYNFTISIVVNELIKLISNNLLLFQSGESACVNNRISKGPYCPVLPHHNQTPAHHQYNLHPHRQPLFQHVRNVSRTPHVQYRHGPARAQNGRRDDRLGENNSYRSRPNILSKVSYCQAGH